MPLSPGPDESVCCTGVLIWDDIVSSPSYALAPIRKKSEFAGGAWYASVLPSSLSNQGKEQSGIVLASNLETVLV